MHSPTESSTILTAAALIAGTLLLLLLVCRPTDPDTELARTAREAVQLAREAGSSDESAVLWTGRFRLVAIVVGVSVPLVVALLIWRASAHSDLDPTEIIEAAERFALPGQAPASQEHLATRSQDPLPADRDNKPPTDQEC